MSLKICDKCNNQIASNATYIRCYDCNFHKCETCGKDCYYKYTSCYDCNKKNNKQCGQCKAYNISNKSKFSNCFTCYSKNKQLIKSNLIDMFGGKDNIN